MEESVKANSIALVFFSTVETAEFVQEKERLMESRIARLAV